MVDERVQTGSWRFSGAEAGLEAGEMTGPEGVSSPSALF